jgi:anti-sigma-K factor RskA
MTRDHGLIDELLAARALDALDDADGAALERELAAHGDCEECRRLEAQHRDVAGMLAFALDPRPVSDAMVDRILTEPRTDVATTAPAAAGTPDDLGPRRNARLVRWQAAFGVAAAVALILAFVLATRQSGVPSVPGQVVVAFEGESPGEVALAYTPGEPGALLWATGLPDPGAGKVYEVWMIEDDQPVRGACLTPDDGAVAAYLDADLSSGPVMAVTLESTDCPAAPTTDPIYSVDLGTPA